MTAPGSVLTGILFNGDPKWARALEALPIDSLWVGGHIASRNPTAEAMVTLAGVAAVTERVRVGTSILLLPLYQPAIIAKQVADLDRTGGGRLLLGVGIGGEYPQEFRACQVPIKERGPRISEAIPLLRRLWTAEPVTHDGRFYPMTDVKIHPAPRQQGGPPVIVAGRQEPAMLRAARLGDGWMPYLYSPRRYAASVATIREAAAEAGRDLAGFGWYAMIFVNVRSDGDQARDETATWMGGTYQHDFRETVESRAAAGTPEEVTKKLKEYAEAGVRHFILCPATSATPASSSAGDSEEVIRRLVYDIMPEVREHVAGLGEGDG